MKCRTSGAHFSATRSIDCGSSILKQINDASASEYESGRTRSYSSAPGVSNKCNSILK